MFIRRKRRVRSDNTRHLRRLNAIHARTMIPRKDA
jgi:hypothetical protein